ncbi:MAG: hypothetical protein ACFUZC_06505 [Chthoniobacteraceae bacterium]
MIPSLFSKNFLSTLACGCALVVMFSAATSSSSSSRNSSSQSSSSSSSRSAGSSSGGSSGGSSSSTGARNYKSNTLMEDALIQVDAETRSVVIVTDPKTHDAIAKVIESLDHPRPQVLIKVVFVEVELTNDLEAGLEGSYTFSASRSGTIGSLFGMASAVSSSDPGVFGTITSGNWSATLHALATCGKAKVLSRPSIMARNNQEAVIVVGKEVPIVTNSEVTDGGNTINTVSYQDVGIILRVTPFITGNKSVEMIVAPEISELSGSSVTLSSSASAPIINKRSAETVVVTPNAQTIVIGGLMQKDVSSTTKKVPLLGDIPGLGWAFRYTSKSESKSELLIFLTPYIVGNSEELDRLTVNEANRATLTRQMVTPEEARNELDTLRLIPQVEPPLPTSTIVPAPKVKNATRPAATPKATPAPAVKPVTATKPTPKLLFFKKATPPPTPTPTPTK